MFHHLKKKISNWFSNSKKTSSQSKSVKKSIISISKNNPANSLKNFFSSLKDHCLLITNESLENIEEQFIQNDFGPNIAKDLSKEILNEIKRQNVNKEELVQEIILDKILSYYIKDQIIDLDLNVNPNRKNVLLVSGVNGVGKTTSVGKLAHYFKSLNYKVLLIAADTFRSGAVEQLKILANKAKVDIITPLPNQNYPSAVIYTGLEYAKQTKHNLIICDTSGRLENKKNLMLQLEKINQVIKKQVPDAPHESLLVIDSTIGQSGLKQAQVFHESLKLTGLILTKTDSTCKGGIIFSIKESLNLPVKFLGTGEALTDLESFNLETFINNIIDLSVLNSKKN